MLSALKNFFSSSSFPSEGSPNPSTWDQGSIDQGNITNLGSKAPAEAVNQVPGEELSYGTEQDGVREAEAMTMAWTKTSLGIAYTL